MKKRLYVFRGLPGSGKTTLARKWAPMVIEPDMFRYDAHNKYVFDSDKNAEVLEKTEKLVKYAISNLKMPCLAVTATHVKKEHFAKYVLMGQAAGYSVTVVECYDNFGNDHDVPAAVIAKMAKEFQPMRQVDVDAMGVQLIRVHLLPARGDSDGGH